MQILGLNNELRDSKYLGLPSLIGRSKKSVFNFVKEKIWRRVNDWNHKSLSKAGKSVMVKNVALSIPSYSMSCFLLPKSMCLEIEWMLNGYWWGQVAIRANVLDEWLGVSWLFLKLKEDWVLEISMGRSMSLCLGNIVYGVFVETQLLWWPDCSRRYTFRKIIFFRLSKGLDRALFGQVYGRLKRNYVRDSDGLWEMGLK